MKYVILGQLAGIGGWQLYIDARATYIGEKGYNVYLISICREKDIKLASFQESMHLCIPEVHMPPASYTKKQQVRILNKLCEFIGEEDEMVIESTDMNLSMWGEMIAQHYNARNFAYLLHSHFPQQNRFVQDFFLYKYQRDELAGMSDLTLPELFNNHPVAEQVEARSLPAAPKDPISDENKIEDITSRILLNKEEHNAFVVGYFGNLDKPHFTQLCEFIEQYSKDNHEYSFLFVSVGSSGKGIAERRQRHIENNVKNCKIINIPSMYPVPKQLFQTMDVCLASWGSSENSARAGALTIRLLDDVTIIPHGIIGISIKDYKSPRCSESLTEIMDKIRNGEYAISDVNIERKPYDYTIAHNLIDQQIFKCIHDKERYDISKIKTVSKRSEIEKKLNTIFGIEITKGIMVIIKKVLAKPYNIMQRKESYAK